jgi:hypothetical protein
LTFTFPRAADEFANEVAERRTRFDGPFGTAAQRNYWHYVSRRVEWNTELGNTKLDERIRELSSFEDFYDDY